MMRQAQLNFRMRFQECIVGEGKHLNKVIFKTNLMTYNEIKWQILLFFIVK